MKHDTVAEIRSALRRKNLPEGGFYFFRFLQPVYQTQNVWVEGRYVDTVQPNGTVLRTWQPGHYEQRTIQVQGSDILSESAASA